MAAEAGNPFGSSAAAGNPFGDATSPAAAPASAATPVSPGDPFASSSRHASLTSSEPVAGNPFGDAAPCAASAASISSTPAATTHPDAADATMEDDGPFVDLKVGLLEKQGEPKRVMGVVAGKPGWRARYVNISKMKLTYHASEEEAETRTRPIKNNFIQLTGYAVLAVDDDPEYGMGALELLPTLPHLDRVWVFRAPGGPAERDVWITAFRNGGCLMAEDKRAAEAVAKRNAERAAKRAK